MKKQILFINDHLNIGGCEKSLVNVLRHMDYEKYDIDLLLLREAGDYINDIPSQVNIMHYHIDNAFGSFLPTIKKAIFSHDSFSILFRLIYIISNRINLGFYRVSKVLFKNIKNNYYAIVAYRPGLCTELSAYAFKSPNKITWWHHGEMFIKGNSFLNLVKSYGRMSSIITVSESCADMLRKNFPKYKEKIHVIPNMICPEELIQKSNLKTVLTDRKKMVICSVSRMSPEKNMIACVYIAEELKKQTEDFIWYVIGDGIEYNKIQELIKEKKLEKNVILQGSLSNPYSYMRKADVFVHTSLVESQGMVILESMALGTAVIAVESDGPKEYIKNGINGYLVNEGKSKIVQLILELNNKSNRARIEEKALETVRLYSPEFIMKKIENILDN